MEMTLDENNGTGNYQVDVEQNVSEPGLLTQIEKLDSRVWGIQKALFGDHPKEAATKAPTPASKILYAKDMIQDITMRLAEIEKNLKML